MTAPVTRTAKLFDPGERVRLDGDILISNTSDLKQQTGSPSQCHLMIEIKRPLSNLSLSYSRDGLQREALSSACSSDQPPRILVDFPLPRSNVTFFIDYSVSSSRKSWCIISERPPDVIRNFLDVSHRIIPHGPTGFYIQVVLKSTSLDDIENITFQLNVPEKCGAVPAGGDRVHHIPNLSHKSRFSKIIEMEFTTGYREIDLSYTCRGSVADRQFEIRSDPIKREAPAQALASFPLSLSLIHDRQEIVPAMEPFRVLVRVTSEADVEFTLDVKEDPNGLLPYGEHFFRGVTGGQETSFQFWLIALKQGLLKYPEFVICANGQSKSIDPGGRILVGPPSDVYE
jgi:hypothetical protein